jgi:hypothetical protein
MVLVGSTNAREAGACRKTFFLKSASVLET